MVSQASQSQPFPNQRWQIAPAAPTIAAELAAATHLSPLLTQVLVNRGLRTLPQVESFLQPEGDRLPSPLVEFPDLQAALDLLSAAIDQGQPIAICGDYDADGMTSTALLLRALRHLGAEVDYAIPSRMTEGYGLNCRMVEEFAKAGVGVILTVDNGIAAVNEIARARELGLTVIVTDHHDAPDPLPPANVILNPKLIAETSPYRGLAGVGMAYILAISLAMQRDRVGELKETLLALFTLGTIADLAPLTGVNRRWVKQGLQALSQSQLEGIRALIQVGLGSKQEPLKPEAIGFGLGPRVNAVGRIGDPQLVIELLTTDDPGVALERAMQCEQINQERQRLCREIEQEAIAQVEYGNFDLQEDRVLVLVKAGWHHGVIGIVASRLVERYGVPVFIGTYEDDDRQFIRGSARSIPEFHVFEALDFCRDLLEKCGGHQAAGGFSLKASNLQSFRLRLSTFACISLRPEHLKPLIQIDAQANLADLNLDLLHQVDRLHPCGIDNPDPVFWTPNVRIIEQKRVGKENAHLKLTLGQDAPARTELSSPRSGNLVLSLETPTPRDGAVLGGQHPSARSATAPSSPTIRAIAWRWGTYHPLPEWVDIAYKLRLNQWHDEAAVEIELLGVRYPEAAESDQAVEFYHQDRRYTCIIIERENTRQLRIKNARGQELVVNQGQRQGMMISPNQSPAPIDVSQSHYFQLIKAARRALNV